MNVKDDEQCLTEASKKGAAAAVFDYQALEGEGASPNCFLKNSIGKPESKYNNCNGQTILWVKQNPKRSEIYMILFWILFIGLVISFLVIAYFKGPQIYRKFKTTHQDPSNNNQ